VRGVGDPGEHLAQVVDHQAQRRAPAPPLELGAGEDRTGVVPAGVQAETQHPRPGALDHRTRLHRHLPTADHGVVEADQLAGVAGQVAARRDRAEAAHGPSWPALLATQRADASEDRLLL
jgi:hypothetical protein